VEAGDYGRWEQASRVIGTAKAGRRLAGVNGAGDDKGDGEAGRWAQRLAKGGVIDVPIAGVVAHADDETLWAGSALSRLRNCRLIHVTDGAPRDMADAARLGFADRQAYAAARAAELDRALSLLGASPERLAYGMVDQEAALVLPALVNRLERDLADRLIVVTHPYEGGHPDHDSTALAVRLAVDRLQRRDGKAPAIVEFACYHRYSGQRRFGAFWPDPDSREQVRWLNEEDRARVDAAINAHATQTQVIGEWRPDVECWRAAPEYQFTEPPPPGEALYDGFGWDMTGARWRTLAAEAILAERAWA
jgi:LmbE family N-acetylglucosaminyl deacetylase